MKEIVERYQCRGCVSGSYGECFEQSYYYNLSCENFVVGAPKTPKWEVLPTLPNGFNRITDKTEIGIYDHFEPSEFDQFNIPIWKYLSPEKHTYVRGLSPRVSRLFIYIYTIDVLSQIDCVEITDKMIEEMD
jgi:hypothetical protein